MEEKTIATRNHESDRGISRPVRDSLNRAYNHYRKVMIEAGEYHMERASGYQASGQYARHLWHLLCEGLSRIR